MRSRLTALVACVLLLPAVAALEGTYDPPTDPPTAEPVYATDDVPIAVIEVARDGTLVFGGLGGPVWRLDPGASAPRVIADPPIVRGPEWGLVGLALAPDFEETGAVYITYTTGPPGVDPSELDVEGEARVVRVQDGNETLVHSYTATRFHNSGRLLIHDDLLYLSRGEQNVRMQAQDTKNQAGKILRMTLDGKPAPGNPGETDATFDPYVYSLGHRNPFGLAWDLDRDTLVESEVGNEENEEINVIAPAKNYGWPHCEGYDCVKDVGSEPPIVEYPQVITPTGLAVVGKDYYVGSFNYGQVRRVYETPEGWTDEVYFKHTRGLVVDVERSVDGQWIYYGAWDGVWRIPTHPDSVASLASAIGPEDAPDVEPQPDPEPTPTTSTTPTTPGTPNVISNGTRFDPIDDDPRPQLLRGGLPLATVGVLVAAIVSAGAVIGAIAMLKWKSR